MSLGAEPSKSRSVPIDLVLTAVLGLLTVAISLESFDLSFSLIALGMVALLFAPGYALVAALFPHEGSNRSVLRDEDANQLDFRVTQSQSDSAQWTVTVVERLVLSIGLSVCLVPLVGLGLDLTSAEFVPSVFTGVIGGMTSLLALIAVIRRLSVPPNDRFDPRVLETVADALNTQHPNRRGSAMTLLLIVGLVIAGSGIAFAVATVDRGEQFTEFYLGTEDPETGELVARDYPDEVVEGDPVVVQVGITNQEGRTVDYTVVVLLQLIDEGEVQVSQQLDNFGVTLGPGETIERPHTTRPGLLGEKLRLTYLLYVGAPPENAIPGTNNAYRHVHIWIDVSAD